MGREGVFYPRHNPEDVVGHGVNADLGSGTTADSARGESQLQSGVINTRHVASAGWLVILGLEAEGVHVDASGRHVLVVLVRLDQVEVSRFRSPYF